MSSDHNALVKYRPLPANNSSTIESLTDAPLDAVALVIGNRYGIPFVLPPSPNTHPLQNKPYARDEQRYQRSFASGKTSRGGSNAESVLASARQKAALIAVSSGPMLRPGSRLSTSSCASIATPALAYTKGLREREEKAIEVAAHPDYVQEWGFYMKCYSEGRFNISRPPDPPPRSPDFVYFSAPAVPDEMSRIKAFKHLNVPYSDWAMRRARQLVMQAMRIFDTKSASISFFDRKDEVIKAESGYHRALIPRTESIGAHVLFSMEAMVILDTHQDWRLQHNPLVLGPPYIRFYAAAPLLTAEGHVIGAFAVFDPRAREKFEMKERQKLVESAQMTVADIEVLAEEFGATRKQRSGVTTSNGSINSSGISTPQSAYATFERGVQGLKGRLAAVIPERMEEVDSEYNRITNQQVRAHFSEQPAEVCLHGNPPRVVQKETSLTNRILPEPVRAGYMGPPNLRDTRLPTPPHTPNVFSTGQSKESHHLEVSQPTKPKPQFLMPTTDSSSQTLANSQDHTPRSLISPTAGLGQPSHTVKQSSYCSTISSTPSTPSTAAEAQYLISLIAQTLGWDFLYVLRVHPQNVGPTLAVQDSGFDTSSTELILAHGLPSPAPIFSHLLHLRALRSAGGLIYRDDGATEKVGFKAGIMLPLARIRRDASSSQETLCPVTFPALSSSSYPSSSSSSAAAAASTAGSPHNQTRNNKPNTPVPPPTPSRGVVTAAAAHHRIQAPKEDEICESGYVLGAFLKQTAVAAYEPRHEEIVLLRGSGVKLMGVLFGIVIEENDDNDEDDDDNEEEKG